ncbi:MAG: glycosyltransferase family 9 protein [Limisphaerales bacterium]
MGRILVIRGGALGDFILTLPALAALRTQFPNARVEVLGYPHIARLALLGGVAHAVHPIEARPLAQFFARGGALDPAVAAFFSGFAVIVSYLYDPDGVFQENVARCTRAQFLVGPHRPDESACIHAADTFLSPLQRLAIFDADATPRIDADPTSPGPGRWIAVHPGSGSESKNWPERRWAGLLAAAIEHSDRNLVLLGGEAEGDRLQRLAGELPSRRVHVARSLPLDAVASLLRACELFIGHDSGITHLAAAVGLPCIALWGPSNPTLWRPRGSHITLVQDDAGLPGLEFSAVWEILRPRLTVQPTPP